MNRIILIILLFLTVPTLGQGTKKVKLIDLDRQVQFLIQDYDSVRVSGSNIEWYSGGTLLTIASVSDTVKNFVNVLAKGADSTGATSSSAAFQNAFNAARDTGYVGIVVPKGTYAVKDVRIWEGLTMLVQAATITTVNASSGAETQRDTVSAMFHAAGTSAAATIRGITIVGGTYTGVNAADNVEVVTGIADVFNFWDVDHIRIFNAKFGIVNRAGIIARNVDNMQVKNNFILETNGAGIHLVGGSNIVVENNNVKNVRHAIRALPDTTNLTELNYFDFNGNFFQCYDRAVYLALPSYGNISNNVFNPLAVTGFKGDSTSAIRIVTHINASELPQSPYVVKNIKITDNSFEDYTTLNTTDPEAAVHFDETTTQTIGQGNVIRDNRFNGCEKPNIELEFDADILNNEIDNVSTSAQTGIILVRVQHATDLKKSIRISGNHIVGVTAGNEAIDVDGDSYFRVTDNYVDNSDIKVGHDSGFESQVSDNVIQSGNIEIHGIGTIVSNNWIVSSATDAIIVGSDGDNSLIIGNNIQLGGAVSAILAPQGANGLFICSNNSYNAGQYGIEIVNSSNHIVCHNTMLDKSAYGIFHDENGGGSADNITIIYNVVEGTTGGVLIDAASTGVVAAFNMDHPAGTEITVIPIMIGGIATTSDLSLQTTSGVGTTGADMHFLVGNNGATEAMTILNAGTIGIGTAAPVNSLNVDGAYNFFTDSSTVDDSWGFSTTGLEVLTTGMTIFVQIGVVNTDGATLQINALGAKTVHKLHNQALATGDVEVGQILHLVYDGTEFQLLSQLAQ